MPVTYQQTKWEVLSPESVLPGTCRTKGAWAATWVVRKTILGAFSHLEVSVLAPLAVLPQLPAVVTPEGDYGGLPQAQVLHKSILTALAESVGMTEYHANSVLDETCSRSSTRPISASMKDMEE